MLFQSTLPLRGATLCIRQKEGLRQISIHAPLAGSDGGRWSRRSGPEHFNPRSPCGERPRSRSRRSQGSDFNPRSPCGERPVKEPSSTWPRPFQSTLPLRGATGSTSSSPACSSRFQSTLPLRGATPARAYSDYTVTDFNPRSPCGERQQTCIKTGLSYKHNNEQR